MPRELWTLLEYDAQLRKLGQPMATTASGSFALRDWPLDLERASRRIGVSPPPMPGEGHLAAKLVAFCA